MILIFQVPALIPTIMESLKVVRLDDKNQSQATGKFLTLFWMGFESVHRETLKIAQHLQPAVLAAAPSPAWS